ncbi:MAG: ABC transporter ATP-binding protein [FCB group bacterium]|nr:ABC transporter ATP-binding protein [FCB group bacterium]
MLTFENIEYKYPKNRKRQFALKDISFAVEPGKIFTLLGPNGAGKTTIIRILSGLILPQKGNITICGHDMRRDEYKARRTIGLVLGDERTFYYRLSGRQNLEFFGGLYGLSRSQVKHRVDEVLDWVGLTDDGPKQFMRYSTGLKKRLSLARALLHDPPVLLLDEPNSGVDPESALKIREMIGKFKKEKRTIFLTTHDMEEAEKLSDTIGFLREGELIRKGPLDDYKKTISRKTFVVEFDRSDQTSDQTLEGMLDELRAMTVGQLLSIEGNRLTVEYNGNFDINPVLAAIVRHGLKVERTNTVDPSLEEVFIQLVRNKHV